jgi:hypothetical protein
VPGGEDCACEAGFSGALCTVDDCDAIDCGAHGECGAGVCACQNGFRGKRCEVDPCLPNGAFALQTGRCACKPAYSGGLCHLFSACFGVECGEHGARCDEQDRPASPKDTTAVCACEQGWEGRSCETDQCVAIDCGINGACSRGVRNGAHFI